MIGDIKMKKLTFKQVRQMFWDEIATDEMRKEFRTRKTQNDYSCDIRCAFVDYVDSLNKDGQITDNQYNKITL